MNREISAFVERYVKEIIMQLFLQGQAFQRVQDMWTGKIY